LQHQIGYFLNQQLIDFYFCGTYYIEDADLWVAANSFARKGDGFSSSESGQNYSQLKVEKGAADKSCILVSGQVYLQNYLIGVERGKQTLQQMTNSEMYKIII
jgi:hypothetical protein